MKNKEYLDDNLCCEHCYYFDAFYNLDKHTHHWLKQYGYCHYWHKDFEYEDFCLEFKENSCKLHK